jgi:hypothetical protein
MNLSFGVTIAPAPVSSAACQKGYRMEPVPSRDEFCELMAAAQAGDAAAYDSALRLIAASVRRMVRRQRGFLGADAVEDLV